jgi:GT2 family glycosyltransferase
MLYRYRDTAGSAGKHSGSPAARCDALGDHLQRRGDRGEYEDYLGTGVFRVRFPIVGRPLVSVLVPTGGRRRRIRGATKTLVLNCLESVLARTTYENFEVVCAVDDDTPADVQSALADMAPRVRCITTRGPFDFSAKMNRAAGAARGDYLLWLNDDTEVLDGDWMTALLEYAQQDGIGAVGPKLLLPNGTIQQAGIAFFEALPYHAYWRFPKAHWGAALGALVVARQYLAVGGACLMTPRSSFEQVGGLSEDYPCNLGDIDYCLKLRELGQRCVVTPWAELIHYEAASRPRIAEPESAVRFVRQWGSSVARDPYHDVTWEGAQRPG